jgi:hypothetical protein
MMKRNLFLKSITQFSIIYSHGGSGVTLSWGCGTEVLKRAIDAINTTAKL